MKAAHTPPSSFTTTFTTVSSVRKPMPRNLFGVVMQVQQESSRELRNVKDIFINNTWKHSLLVVISHL